MEPPPLMEPSWIPPPLATGRAQRRATGARGAVFTARDPARRHPTAGPGQQQQGKETRQTPTAIYVSSYTLQVSQSTNKLVHHRRGVIRASHVRFSRARSGFKIRAWERAASSGNGARQGPHPTAQFGQSPRLTPLPNRHGSSSHAWLVAALSLLPCLPCMMASTLHSHRSRRSLAPLSSVLVKARRWHRLERPFPVKRPPRPPRLRTLPSFRGTQIRLRDGPGHVSVNCGSRHDKQCV